MSDNKAVTEVREEPAEALCSVCLELKPLTVEHWPKLKGKPHGNRCRLCARAGKKDFDRNAKQTRVAARLQTLATLAEAMPEPASKGVVAATREKLPAELPLRQLQIVQALREGAQLLNERARTTLERLFRYAETPTHPHHEWALKLIADRLMPRKLYEDLGARDAGLGKVGEGGARPSVTIIVQPATAPTPAESSAFKVVEGESERI